MDPLLTDPGAYRFLMLDAAVLRALRTGASGNARTGRDTGAIPHRG